MKRFSRRSVVFSSVFLAGSIAPAVFGQDVAIIQEEPKMKEVRGQEQETTSTDPDAFVIESREPIEFSELPMIDPGSGREVGPHDLMTLKNGERVEAGNFYRQLFELEKYLNGQGYRTRHESRDVPRQTYDFARPKDKGDDPGRMRAHLNRFPVMEVQKAFTEVVADKVKVALQHAKSIIEIISQGLDTHIANEFRLPAHEQIFSYYKSGYGFEGYVDSLVWGKDREAWAHANAVAKVTLQNEPFYPLVVNTFMGTNAQKAFTNLLVETLGMTIYDESYTMANMVWDTPAGYWFYQSKGFSHNFGPLKLQINLSYGGDADIRYMAGAGPVYAYGNVDAALRGKVSISGSNGGAGGSYGVFGELIPIDDKLTMRNEIGQRFQHNRVDFCGKVQANNEVVTALKGKLGAYVVTPEIDLWFFSIGGDRYDTSFFDSQGFHDAPRDLYNFEKCQAVYQ